ncbi:unnamed protein product [Vitrella brassicaformis CCMP3155]|uniref:Uncharacterized protein n=1 Tax=Vitrella brassicaformis (strain CCMP3155) TaxID=1169540 RepID=A0A0G4EE91_VITBC|nr:unnamed protein product [Vitrella brassicaformis CCMP3155]|eukprot:CEL94297.1 unnamed protein product [Vitrella brassicaformis CCMP3155]
MSEASKSVWVDGKCIKSVKEYAGLLSASEKPAACENGGRWTKWWDLDRRDLDGVIVSSMRSLRMPSSRSDTPLG